MRSALEPASARRSLSLREHRRAPAEQMIEPDEQRLASSPLGAAARATAAAEPADGRAIIKTIEAGVAKRIGPEPFEALCRSMQDLLDEFDPRLRQQYTAPPERPNEPVDQPVPGTRLDPR